MQKPRWKLESFDETLKVQIGGVGDKFINFFFFFFSSIDICGVYDLPTSNALHIHSPFTIRHAHYYPMFSFWTIGRICKIKILKGTRHTDSPLSIKSSGSPIFHQNCTLAAAPVSKPLNHLPADASYGDGREEVGDSSSQK